MIDPRKLVLFVPPVLSQFKRMHFERFGRMIINHGGSLAHDYDEVIALPDEKIPIVGVSPQFRNQLLYDWPNRKRDFVFWDRGYLRRAYTTWFPRGDSGGYYRWTLNGYQMKEVRQFPDDRWKALRLDDEVRPWQKNGRHILVASTGFDYWDVFADRDWVDRTVRKLELLTDREIRVRGKLSQVDLRVDLDGAHALVTHGSIAAVEAAIWGCPVFTHEFSAAKFVGRTDLEKIESPVYPDRSDWLRSLAYSQYNEQEVGDGTIFKLLW